MTVQETRRAARDLIKPTAETLRQQVLAYLTRRGAYGATDEEMQNNLNMKGNTQRPRRRELVLAGKVKDSGKTRPTATSKATVWIATGQETQATLF